MRFRCRSSIWAGIAACFILAPGTSLRAQSGRAFSRSPYLQFQGTNMMHIAWRTMGPMTPVVRYGTRLDALDELVSTNAIVSRASLGSEGQTIPARWQSLRTTENLKLPKLHSAPVGSFQYEARLTNLVPATRYYYSVFDGHEQLTPPDPSYSFLTPPPVGSRTPVRFSVIGDSGTARPTQRAVFTAMLEQVGKGSRSLDFWLHVGDMAYGTGRDMEFQTRVFEPYEALMRNTVCWPTMGNHEGGNSQGATGIGPYYDAYVVPTRGEVGGVASGTEAYYSFDHANIHFICLDSHDLDRKPGGAMARWLKADLERTRADWLIGFWHHPPYTKGSHDSDKEKDLVEMRQYIMPILESGGVDVVLTGHSHIYERSMLMDGAYATPTISDKVIFDDGDGDPNGDGAYRKSAGIHPHRGTVQVVAGHGGERLGRVGSMPVMKRILVEHGSVLVDINGDSLTARMINQKGAVRDLFTLVKKGTVDPIRLPLPWQLADYKKPDTETRALAEPPVNNKVLIPNRAEWQFLATEHPQGLAWTQANFDAGTWKKGRGGFGFGDGRFETPISKTRGQSPAIYLRKEFQIDQPDAVTELGLLMDYEGGFIAYINGQEVLRQNIGRSSGRNVQNVKMRTDDGTVFLRLPNAYQHLVEGSNILAIEAHATAEALDFLLDPSLLVED